MILINDFWEQALQGILAAGQEKEGTSLQLKPLEFEYLHRKRRNEILIGRDDNSNDVITLRTCFSIFFFHLSYFPLCADWRKSHSSVNGIGGEIEIPEM